MGGSWRFCRCWAVNWTEHVFVSTVLCTALSVNRFLVVMESSRWPLGHRLAGVVLVGRENEWIRFFPLIMLVWFCSFLPQLWDSQSTRLVHLLFGLFYINILFGRLFVGGSARWLYQQSVWETKSSKKSFISIHCCKL